MASDLVMKLLPDIMENLHDNVFNQQEINDSYARIIDLILTEAESSLTGRNTRRKNTKFKSYWNAELSVKWKLMHESERIYRKVCKDQKSVGVCREKQLEFKNARRALDKLLKKRKRSKGILGPYS